MSNKKEFTGAQKMICQILDPGSFMEIGEAVTARLTDFYTPDTQDKPSDGVITGYGTIDGQLVYIFSQDAVYNYLDHIRILGNGMVFPKAVPQQLSRLYV